MLDCAVETQVVHWEKPVVTVRLVWGSHGISTAEDFKCRWGMC